MRTVGLLLDRTDVVLFHLEVHRDGGRLDGNTTLLFILSCIRKPHVTSLSGGDDTGLGHQRIGESGLSVVD